MGINVGMIEFIRKAIEDDWKERRPALAVA
jgi:hypothetical protein